MVSLLKGIPLVLALALPCGAQILPVNKGGTGTNTTSITYQCADSSGSGTAQSCTTSPSFTPAANNCVLYTTTTTNSGAGLTINVNSLGAKSVAISSSSGWTTTLTSSQIPANTPLLACYTGTNWNVGLTGIQAASGGASGPTFKGYGFFAPGSSSTTAATTTAVAAVAVGDLLVQFCRAGSTLTFTSTPSETWNAITAAGTGVQMAWAIAANSGSHTGTCTQSASNPFQGNILMDYSGTGTSLNTSANNSGATASGTYPFGTGGGGTYSAATTASTSQRTLIIYCNNVDDGTGRYYLAGWINGQQANLRAVDGGASTGTIGTSGANVSGGCEDLTTAGATSQITATLGYNSNSPFQNTVAAFNY